MTVLSRGRGGILTGSPPSGGEALLVLTAPRGAGTPVPPGDELESLAAEGETELGGDITLSEGTGITLTQVGNNIEISQ